MALLRYAKEAHAARLHDVTGMFLQAGQCVDANTLIPSILTTMSS